MSTETRDTPSTNNSTSPSTAFSPRGKDVRRDPDRPRKRRLSIGDRLEIVRRHERGETQINLAEEFSVSRFTIGTIVHSMRDTTDEARQMAMGAAASMMQSAINASKVAAKRGRVDPHKLVLGVAGLVHTDMGKPSVTVVIAQAPRAGIPLPALSPPLSLPAGEGVIEASAIPSVSDNPYYVNLAKSLINKE